MSSRFRLSARRAPGRARARPARGVPRERSFGRRCCAARVEAGSCGTKAPASTYSRASAVPPCRGRTRPARMLDAWSRRPPPGSRHTRVTRPLLSPEKVPWGAADMGSDTTAALVRLAGGTGFFASRSRTRCALRPSRGARRSVSRRASPEGRVRAPAGKAGPGAAASRSEQPALFRRRKPPRSPAAHELRAAAQGQRPQQRPRRLPQPSRVASSQRLEGASLNIFRSFGMMRQLRATRRRVAPVQQSEAPR